MLLSIAQVVPVTAAEGPGRRFAVWFQGCPLRCPGCCNPEFLPFTGGTPTDGDALLERLAAAATNDGVTGLTLLGGEPVAHAEGARFLACGARRLGLDVMLFSGYRLEEIRASADPFVAELLAATDLLVDGPYDRASPDTRRRWIGSTNQRIHFLTDRHRPDDDCWRRPNTLEIRWSHGELSVNGFPAATALPLWRRPGGPQRGRREG